MPVKHLGTMIGGGTPSKADESYWVGDIPWASAKDFGVEVLVDTTDHISQEALDESSASLVPAGSVLVVARSGILRHSLPVARAAVPLAINQDLKAILPNQGVDSSFLQRLLSGTSQHALNTCRQQGTTVESLDVDHLRGLCLPMPALSTQRMVAAYLARETAEIGALIEQKRRLSDLLEEALLGRVYDALSRGLERTTLRPAGLPWLPTLPTHWTVEPLRGRYSVHLGKMLNPHASGGANLAPYLRNVNVQWDHVDVSDLNEMSFDEDERARLSLKHGDLLVCEGGEVGRTAIWRGELPVCFFQKAVHRLRRRRQVDSPRYLYYVMRVAAKAGAFRAGGNRSTIVHLTKEKLQAHQFPFPPPAEQAKIVQVLDRATAEAGRLQALVGQQIGKLHERRAALITAAVTGELDIPGA